MNRAPVVLRICGAAAIAIGAAILQSSLAKEAEPESELRTHGVDHVGMNVPDIDAAVSFFAELLGAHVLWDIRPEPLGMDWKRRLSWHLSSRLERIVLLQTPAGDRFELFQYQGPEVTWQQPHADDVGATHVAFRVDDISVGVAVVRRHGLHVLSDPIVNSDGTRWFYFLSPWNARIELVASPNPQPLK